jgi:hypothetical protein
MMRFAPAASFWKSPIERASRRPTHLQRNRESSGQAGRKGSTDPEAATEEALAFSSEGLAASHHLGGMEQAKRFKQDSFRKVV